MSTPENVADWRDLADQLTPQQLTGLEELAAEADQVYALMPQRPRKPVDEHMLANARRIATTNMLNAVIGDAEWQRWPHHDC